MTDQPIRKDAAYYAEDKKRQESVDKRGHYSKDDQRYIARTGNDKDKARMTKPRRPARKSAR
jgi:hypothetical protein